MQLEDVRYPEEVKANAHARALDRLKAEGKLHHNVKGQSWSYSEDYAEALR